MIYSFKHKKIEYCGQCPCFNDDGGGCKLGVKYVDYHTDKPCICPLDETNKTKEE